MHSLHRYAIVYVFMYTLSIIHSSELTPGSIYRIAKLGYLVTFLIFDALLYHFLSLEVKHEKELILTPRWNQYMYHYFPMFLDIKCLV